MRTSYTYCPLSYDAGRVLQSRDVNQLGTRDNAFDKASQYAARTELNEPFNAVGGHQCNRLVPAHSSRHLDLEFLSNSCGVRDNGRRGVGQQGDKRRRNFSSLDCHLQSLDGRPHKTAVEGATDVQGLSPRSGAAET